MSKFSIDNALPWRFRIWLAQQKRRNALTAIDRLADPHSKELCRAIEKTVNKRYSDEERTLIESIERLRESCIGSNEEIEFLDYGAGEPSDPQSTEQSRQGIKKRISLKTLAAHTSKREPWSDLIFNLVRELGPRRCLELGTCIGFSAAYQCAAMMLNGNGMLATLEGASSFAAKSRNHLSRLGVSNFEIVVGRFEDTLDATLTKYAPFDFMFNDGHHDGQAMLSYFEKCLPSFSNDAVLLFDDIAAYPSMQAAWQRLRTHDRVSLAIDFGPMGLVALRKQTRGPSSIFHFEL